ncbi:hypothetical protein AB6A40_001716 [Gnathostoma spinigerum]|uniref:Uncharacterized protein n=1 Tax=Gnathostoma spinigerum TaxID=75299 RepID=A0ABD6EEQ3_9BILA
MKGERYVHHGWQVKVNQHQLEILAMEMALYALQLSNTEHELLTIYAKTIRFAQRSNANVKCAVDFANAMRKPSVTMRLLIFRNLRVQKLIKYDLWDLR